MGIKNNRNSQVKVNVDSNHTRTTGQLIMRHRSTAIVAILLCSACVCHAGCKSMKSKFPKVAFWKKDKPPVSELASRASAAPAPPSQSASVLDGTIDSPNSHSGSELARSPYGKPSSSPARDSYASSSKPETEKTPVASAYGNASQTSGTSSPGERYASVPPPATSTQALGNQASGGSFGQPTSNSKFAFSQNADSQSPASSKPASGFGDPRSMANPYAQASATKPAVKNNASSGIPGYKAPAATTSNSTGLNSSFASTGSASIDKPATVVPTTGQYPSTKFGSFASPVSAQQSSAQSGFRQCLTGVISRTDSRNCG